MSVKSHRTRLWILWMLSLLLFFPAAAAPAQPPQGALTVIAIGSGNIFGKNPAGARDRAVDHALVTAVEQASSGLLAPEARIQRFSQLNEILYSRTDNFVQTYRVLTEASSGKKYRVLIEATVSLEKIKQALGEIGLVGGKKGLPSILILVSEQNVGDVLPQFWWGEEPLFTRSASEGGLQEALHAAGFQVIDHGTGSAAGVADLNIDQAELSDENALLLGRRLQAGVVVVGRAAANKAGNVMGGGVQSFEGKLEVRALRVDTGAQITRTEQSTVTTATDEAAGGRAAISKAAVQVGQSLAERILAEWRMAGDRPVRVEMTVKGSQNLANFMAFRRKLSSLSSVSGIEIRELRADEADLLIDYQGSAGALADTLMITPFDYFGLRISELTENHLRVELVPK